MVARLLDHRYLDDLRFALHLFGVVMPEVQFAVRAELLPPLFGCKMQALSVWRMVKVKQSGFCSHISQHVAPSLEALW